MLNLTSSGTAITKWSLWSHTKATLSVLLLLALQHCLELTLRACPQQGFWNLDILQRQSSILGWLWCLLGRRKKIQMETKFVENIFEQLNKLTKRESDFIFQGSFLCIHHKVWQKQQQLSSSDHLTSQIQPKLPQLSEYILQWTNLMKEPQLKELLKFPLPLSLFSYHHVIHAMLVVLTLWYEQQQMATVRACASSTSSPIITLTTSCAKQERK